MASIRHKTEALHVQWLQQFFTSSNRWVPLMNFWFMNHFEVPIVDDLTHPLEFSPAKLPLFYASVLRAWRSLHAADPSCPRKSCLSPVNRPTKLSYLRNPALVTALLIKFVLSTRFLPEAFDFYRTLMYMRTP